MAAREQPVVPVVVGPTGVGKTAVALELADRLPLTVISADSRQIYTGLDIGTAKPTADERARVPHCGLDLVEPGERYSAGRFGRDAAGWLAAIDPARQPIVVGGTGFYVRVLAEGLFREPPLDAERRRRMREWLDRLPTVAAWATRMDRAFTGGGRQRATRATEVALLTGRPLSWWQRRAQTAPIMHAWTVRLTVPRSVLRERIAVRAAAMLEAGLVDEVRGVLARGVAPRAPGLDAVGYREVVRYLAGDMSGDELLPTIVTATRRYAKRQETWFRHQLGHDVMTVDATEPPAVVAERILMAWERRTT